MKIIVRVISAGIFLWLIYLLYISKLNLYEWLYLELVLINIIVIIEISYFFMKKMSLEESKKKFIFKQLDVLILELQQKELVSLENEQDYPKYLLLHKKIDCLLTNLDKVINEKQKEKIKEIQKNFDEYKSTSSECIQRIENFNMKTTEYKKIIQRIENSIIELQTQFFL